MARPSAKTSSSPTPSITLCARAGLILLFLLAPVALSLLLYGFDPVPLPDSGSWPSPAAPARDDRILKAVSRLGDGVLNGPEDLAYDAEARALYTGCADGWIRRVRLADVASSVTVDDWAFVGGRPLGLAFGPDKELIVADANKGLLRVSREGVVEVLTEEAEGVKFRLTDGVDVSREDGVIYFTDASHKHSLDEPLTDVMEGYPNGRLLSFDPSTKTTQVLLRRLYFANGVALSPHHDFLVFCESVMRRCRKYHIQGEKKGLVDDFIDNLPGFPDNIRYDGYGSFWIAMASGRTMMWDTLMRYPFLRKMVLTIEKFVKVPLKMQDGGVLEVSLEGELLASYTDPNLFGVTCGLKIENHLYYGMFSEPYIGRIDLTHNAARASSMN